MKPIATRNLALLDAQLGSGKRICLRIENGRIASVGTAPRPGDLRIDLQGDRILPGLINAHDHLSLNALPRLKYRDGYANVSEWVDDIRPRLGCDPMFVANQAVPREDRLLLGGVKNLLSGVTTVAHHDPLYPSLCEPGFPTRVVTRYGWSHSLAMDGEEAVRQSHRECPRDRPWIVHAAEGVDGAAGRELSQLESLGCLAANTVVVHGLALNRQQHGRLSAAGAGLVWCPASNLHLFGKTIDMGLLADRRHVALGSDSRLSGASDLLAELSVARTSSRLGEAELESFVTGNAARILRLPDRGVLEPGTLADILVLAAGQPLSQARRADIRLVLLGGEPRYADPDYAAAFGDDAEHVRVELDGRSKCLSGALFSRLAKAVAQEPGLVLTPQAFAPAAERFREVAR